MATLIRGGWRKEPDRGGEAAAARGRLMLFKEDATARFLRQFRRS